MIIKPNTEVTTNNPLEDALNKLDLQSTLVLLTVLTQRALFLQQESIKTKAKVTKILSTDYNQRN